jgi:hypothetical protein
VKQLGMLVHPAGRWRPSAPGLVKQAGETNRTAWSFLLVFG